MTLSDRTASSTNTNLTSASRAIQTLFTTPFERPSGCVHEGVFTTITSYSYQPGTTFIISDPSRERTCQPGGRDADFPQFHYSPAVCPSGWTAYALEVRSNQAEKYESRAVCCNEYVRWPSNTHQQHCKIYRLTDCGNRGFVYSTDEYIPFRGVGGACVQRPKAVRTVVTIHDPWAIAWQRTDTEYLSPRPPTMTATCTGSQIAAWVPGSKVDKAQKAKCETHNIQPREIEGEGPYEPFGPAWFWLWLPILIVILIGFGLCFGCYKNKKRKRLERAQRAARDRPAQWEAGVGDEIQL